MCLTKNTKDSLCTEPPSPQEKLVKEPSPILSEGRGVCTQAN